MRGASLLGKGVGGRPSGRSPADGRDEVDLALRLDLRTTALVRDLAVHGHGDVGPDAALLGAKARLDPGEGCLEVLDDLADRGALDLDLALATRELLEQRRNLDLRHSYFTSTGSAASLF